MTNQRTGLFQKSQEEAPVSNGQVSAGEVPAVAVLTLTMSRGSRPLSTRCAANSDLHSLRRRSA